MIEKSTPTLHRTLIVYVLTLGILLFFGGTALAVSFGEVEKNLDPDRNTKVATQGYWKKVKGKEVTWSGTVDDVKGGRSKFKVLVKVGGASKANVTLVTADHKAEKLRKGQSVSFTGTLSGYRNWFHKVSIELKDVKIQ